MKTVMIFVYIQQPLCVLIERVRPSKIKNHLRVLQDCFQTAKNYGVYEKPNVVTNRSEHFRAMQDFQNPPAY